MTHKTIKPAQGTKGVLIRSLGTYFFRVYNEDYSFTDYDLRHSDLAIEITDSDSAFYDDQVLDHSPETLGITTEGK